MANTVQAKKRARQSESRRQLNASLRSAMRTAIKKVTKAAAEKNKDAAQSAYREATAVIDRIARKGVIHANAAARQKSRLNARVRAAGA